MPGKKAAAKRGEVCPECGQVHERCVGHRSDGQPCRNRPIRGGDVCAQTHGGAARHVKAAAQRRLAKGAAFKALAEMDIEPLGDPMEALADLAADAMAYYRWCADRVNELREQLRYEHERAAEQLRAEIGMYERAMERAQKFIADYRKLQIAEHPLKVEHSGELTLRDVVAGFAKDAM